MEPATTIDFASAARTLTREARRRGLVAPSYRCPPRVVGLDRSIRRRPGVDAGAVIAVRVAGRPVAAMLADMIEGVVVANRLRAPHADRLRAELWVAVERIFVSDSITSDARGDDSTSGTARIAPIAGAA
jgi:hypothetical protein